VGRGGVVGVVVKVGAGVADGAQVASATICSVADGSAAPLSVTDTVASGVPAVPSLTVGEPPVGGAGEPDTGSVAPEAGGRGVLSPLSSVAGTVALGVPPLVAFVDSVVGVAVLVADVGLGVLVGFGVLVGGGPPVGVRVGGRVGTAVGG
jgi:hypothetical protein